MAKFRMRLKIQGFELEVDGEREDIPAITSAIQQQLSGLIQPAEMMVDDQKQLAQPSKTIEGEGQRRTQRFDGRHRNPGDRVSARPGDVWKSSAVMVRHREVNLASRSGQRRHRDEGGEWSSGFCHFQQLF